MYFGSGGVGNERVVELNDDMVSINGRRERAGANSSQGVAWK
jgi:hypothetical protein